jgi:hypothetical protein
MNRIPEKMQGRATQDAETPAQGFLKIERVTAGIISLHGTGLS